jgi:hypothetical protein
MQWFVNLMEEVGIECLIGHPAEIRATEPRKQKHDRRDADLILKHRHHDDGATRWCGFTHRGGNSLRRANRQQVSIE